MLPPNFTKAVIVSGDWHTEKPFIRLNGQLLSKLTVHARFLDYISHWGAPLLLIYAGDIFETRSAFQQRLVQERLESEGSSLQPEDLEKHLENLDAELKTTAKTLCDQLKDRELLDITIFLPGNHDPIDGLYKLIGTYDAQILPYARIPMLDTTALIKHGAFLGMEQAAAVGQKEPTTDLKKNQPEAHRKKYGTALLRKAKEKLTRETTGLGFRVPNDWWVVLGHYASPLANPDYQVAGFSNWEGEIGGQHDRCIIQIDPQDPKGVSVVKIPKGWLIG